MTIHEPTTRSHFLTPRKANSPQSPSGFTLLEVILSLAILGGSLAVLGEIMSLANRQAADAQLETTAQMLAENLLDEIAAGVIPLEEAAEDAVESPDGQNWQYEIAIEETELENVVVVIVKVQQEEVDRLRPVSYRLVRWVSTIPPSSPASAEDASGGGATSGAGSSGVGDSGGIGGA